jgi:hypothetical protein
MAETPESNVPTTEEITLRDWANTSNGDADPPLKRVKKVGASVSGSVRTILRDRELTDADGNLREREGD